MPDAKKAATLIGAQLRHLLRVTDATSRAPERDRLVLLLDLTCAMRITEIARVLVDDVLLPSGAVRGEVSLRAAITKGWSLAGLGCTRPNCWKTGACAWTSSSRIPSNPEVRSGMHWDVIAVEPVAPLSLRVEFMDGTSGKVRFLTSHLTGVFASLKDPEVLKQVHIDGGAVAWPSDVDLAPRRHV